jgi:hypothetical protein
MERMDTLSGVPSPYIAGIFDDLVKKYPDYYWNVTLETNRGCPYQCTFCDWGGLIASKMKKFDLHRIEDELKWIVQQKVGSIFIADSNLGIFFERDKKIARMIRQAADKLGVDYIEFSPNPIIRSKLNRLGLENLGDISWPEHVGIFTIPVRVAVQYNVPLIIWGENSQNEYGGPASDSENNHLTRKWLEEFGGLLGMRVSDLLSYEGIEKKHLISYTYPNDEELERVGVTGLFLGYYLPWDGLSNMLIAQANGFNTYSKTVEGSYVNYENLDNYQTGIHDYFKFLKFGFGRASDIASLHIRRERISRRDGIDAVKKLDGGFPWTYLGKPLSEILKPLKDYKTSFKNKTLVFNFR